MDPSGLGLHLHGPPLSHLHTAPRAPPALRAHRAQGSPENHRRACPSFIIQESQGYKKCMSNRRNSYPVSGRAGILSRHKVKSRHVNTRCKCSCPARSAISSITAGDCAFPRSASPGKHRTCHLSTTAADLMPESTRHPFRPDLSRGWGDRAADPLGEKPTKPAGAQITRGRDLAPGFPRPWLPSH